MFKKKYLKLVLLYALLSIPIQGLTEEIWVDPFETCNVESALATTLPDTRIQEDEKSLAEWDNLAKIIKFCTTDIFSKRLICDPAMKNYNQVQFISN